MLKNLKESLPMLGLFISVIVGFPGIFMWGQNSTESKLVSIYEQKISELKSQNQKNIEDIKNKYDQEIVKLNDRLEQYVKEKPLVRAPVADIFVSGHFADGLQIASDASNEKRNWVTRLEDSIHIAYPGGADWGVWFVSVGASAPRKENRSSMDVSMYSMLSLELKGEAGSKVAIALKDTEDPDDGSESRNYLTLRSSDWETYKVDLKNFETTDLKNLYIVTSFIFAKQPQTVFVRKIQFE